MVISYTYEKKVVLGPQKLENCLNDEISPVSATIYAYSTAG